MRLLRTAALLAAGTGLLLPGSASAAKLAGVDTAGRLVTFDSAKPGSVESVRITGLGEGETLVGLDRRPAGGTLFAVSSASRLYVVGTDGKAAAVGSPLSPALDGRSFGFDFNPMVDRIRLVSDFAQNLRLQPDMGTVAATDGRLAYATGDANAGKAPGVVGSAYTNNVPMAMATQLFAIDARNDVLALQDPPNPGGLKTVGALGRDVVSPVGFDIASGSGDAFLVSRVARQKGSRLFQVTLADGTLRQVGRVGTGRRPVTLRGLTVVG